jgi:curved DNA-binding protein CbpA
MMMMRAVASSRFFFLFFFLSFFSYFISGEKDLNPYAILGVDKTADASAIKRSYRKLSLRFHPDKQHTINDDEEKEKIERKFMSIQMAYKTLIDPEKRRNYDVTGYANLKDLERDEKRKEKEEGEKKGGYQRFTKKKGSSSSSSSSRMKRGGWDSEEQTIDSIDSETFDFTSLSAFESIVFNRRRNSKDNNAGAGGGNSWLIEVYDDASEPSQRASSSWEQASRALDGFAKFGRVNQKLYRRLAVKVAPKYFMSNEPIAFTKLPAVVGFAQGCNNFWCAQR